MSESKTPEAVVAGNFDLIGDRIKEQERLLNEALKSINNLSVFCEKTKNKAMMFMANRAMHVLCGNQ